MDLSHLNPPQREAVLYEGGPLVVFAGAGSGKTRVITHRVAHLCAEREVRPWKILAVTFTNKAAGEMRERCRGLLGDEARSLWVGTFHAVCARVLRAYAEPVRIRRDFTIYDDSDQQSMVRRVIKDMGLDERRYTPRMIAGHINRAKQEMVKPDAFEGGDPVRDVARRVYEAYEKRMDMCGALDFGDLIYRLVVSIEEDDALRREIAGRWDHVLVDEFQDTNHAQYRLVRALCAQHRNLCVVGDDDQSIYRWRGADRRNILDFRTEFPEATIVKLEQNYRSTKRVLRLAHAIIRRNVDREPKELWTENTDGPKALVVRCEDERDEARMMLRAVSELSTEGLSLDDIAVFYRTHALSRVLEEVLRGANVPYRVVGGMRFYDRAEVKDILAYLRVLQNPGDDVSLERIVNTPTRGIGKTTMDRVMDHAARDGIGAWEAMRRCQENPAHNAGARKKLLEFVALIEDLRERLTDGTELVHIGTDVIDRTGYLAMLENDDTPESDARLENVRELLGSMQDFQKEAEKPTLDAFLELVTLQTSADEAAGLGEARLTLMTVHAAKGLEFPAVLVMGLEEQLFPLRGGDAYEDPEEMEEERRLAYVAFTRAEERLILSFTGRRMLYGQSRVNQPSRFLLELPEADIEWLGARPMTQSDPGYRRPHWRELEPGPSRAPRENSDEAYIDTSEGSDIFDEGLFPGSRVRHVKFGIGTVRAVDEGLPPRVTVDFPGWGTKRIALSYLEPA